MANPIKKQRFYFLGSLKTIKECSTNRQPENAFSNIAVFIFRLPYIANIR